MQFADAIMHVQQVNTSSNSIEDGCFSTLSHKLLLSNPMQYQAETISTITLDCSGLEPINSHGICLLIKLLIYAKCQKKRLQIFGLSEHNRYIFKITRLDKFIDIVETEASLWNHYDSIAVSRSASIGKPISTSGASMKGSK